MSFGKNTPPAAADAGHGVTGGVSLAIGLFNQLAQTVFLAIEGRERKSKELGARILEKANRRLVCFDNPL
jgi:hypothetical protein